jgi:hypothetical protein
LSEPEGLRVVAIQRGVATESWSVPVGGERCNQTKCLPGALVRIIAFSYNTHTWHAFDLVDKSSPLRVDDLGTTLPSSLGASPPSRRNDSEAHFLAGPEGLFRKGSPEGLYHREPEPGGPEPALAGLYQSRKAGRFPLAEPEPRRGLSPLVPSLQPLGQLSAIVVALF